VHATATAELTVTPYPDVLGTARGLLDRDQFGIAVVVAHMACEVATERRLTEAFAAKGVPDLEEPVLGFLSGYSLANDRNRKLYSALTSDEIAAQSFWAAFKDSASLRNAIIHRGATATRAEAEKSLAAAAAFTRHVQQ
jgi:hypothetical protein